MAWVEEEVYGQPLHRPCPPPWLVQSLSATLPCSTWVPLCIGHRATHERSPPPAPIPPRAAQPCIMHPAPVNGEMLPETAQVESSQGVTSCVSACASYTGIALARSPERHRHGTLDPGRLEVLPQTSASPPTRPTVCVLQA